MYIHNRVVFRATEWAVTLRAGDKGDKGDKGGGVERQRKGREGEENDAPL